MSKSHKVLKRLQPVSTFFPLVLMISSFSWAQLDSSVVRLALPEAIVSFYESLPDDAISDDFNGADLDTSANGWNYRDDSQWTYGDPKVMVGIVDSSYLSLRGEGTGDQGSGISSKNSSQYGFYMTKWRVDGISGSQPTCWHPAIWASKCNFAQPYECLETGNERLEIDYVEGFHHSSKPYWHSKNITWKTANGSNSTALQYLKENSTDWPTKQNKKWLTMGYEYTPDYTRLWMYENDTWVHVHTIPWTQNGTINGVQMNEVYREPVYWILSMIHPNCSYDGADDAWFHIDYFYHYPYKVGSSLLEDGKTYALKSFHTGRHLTHSKGSANGYVSTDEVDHSLDAQDWQIDFLDNDEFQYYSVTNQSTGLALRGYDPSSVNTQGTGANVTSSHIQDFASYQWRFFPSHEKGQFYAECRSESNYLRGYDPFDANRDDNGASATLNQLKMWGSLLWEPIIEDNMTTNIFKQSISPELSLHVRGDKVMLSVMKELAVHQVTIFNSRGQKIYSSSMSNDYIINLSGLSHGVYIIDVQTDKGLYSKKLSFFE